MAWKIVCTVHYASSDESRLRIANKLRHDYILCASESFERLHASVEFEDRLRVVVLPV